MDRLDAMRSFTRVAELGSFAAVAQQLGVARSVVTRQVAALEAHLGTKLMLRSTRRLALTAAGTAYLEKCRVILNLIDAAETDVAAVRAEARGHIRVGLPPCAFCSIPRIKGTAVSRPPEAIVREARVLAQRGVRELILIAQDLTDYGHDLGLKDGLPALLESICDQAPELKWIRLMYQYPGAVSDRLIEVMATRPQIVHYVDIPLQHGHPEVLKRMRRPANIDWVYRTFEEIRAAMPDVAIRTTFIVGYPGATAGEFDGLLKFVRDLQFDRVGAFQYPFEPGTPSADLPDQIPEEVKQERYEHLMEMQQAISLKGNQAHVGRTLKAITLDREVMHLRDSLITRYAELVYCGYWISPEREALQTRIDSILKDATGEVRLKLYKGNCLVVGRRSEKSLYDPQLATFEEEEIYNQKDAEGFKKLNALRLRVRRLLR